MLEEISVVAVIPARYGSTRFPGKPLALLAGKPMIQHVYERVRRSSLVSDVLVATDDQRILRAVEQFGGKAILTSPDHPSGTDRVGEVAAGLDAGVVVNVQGDEPLIDPQVVDQAVRPLLQDASLQMTTLAHKLESSVDMANPDVVKVRIDKEGFARSFFRLPEAETGDGSAGDHVLKHVGLYAYRRPYLLELIAMQPTEQERALGLEQLRALEHGCRIKVVVTEYGCLGVDRPEDLKRAELILSAQKEVPS
jgi:3-deoxy-manno-octulosonate cytidylyltransferase (CMP-KDO synthetase)